MRDLYEVLGVEKTASQADLKKAYHKLAQEKFKECANAYQILSDDDQRAAYDRYGFDGLRGRGAGPQNVEDIFSAFGGLFGDFFGGRGGGGRRAPAAARRPGPSPTSARRVRAKARSSTRRASSWSSRRARSVAAPASRSRKRARTAAAAASSPRPRRCR